MGRRPLWTAVHAALSDDLAQGRYRPGDRLPTEAALAGRFGVNRHTVRRALAALIEEGSLRSRQGAGVFVRQTPMRYPIGKRVRYHQSLAAAGRIPDKRILHLETRRADAREAEVLALAPDARVHVYEGLSLADGGVVALFSSVFPAARFPNMLAALQDVPTVTGAFAQHGLTDYTRASTEITAKPAPPTIAAHLQLAAGDPVLRTVAVNVDGDGQPVEFGRTWFAGDRVALTLNAD